MRISDWSSDVCSSDLQWRRRRIAAGGAGTNAFVSRGECRPASAPDCRAGTRRRADQPVVPGRVWAKSRIRQRRCDWRRTCRSEEHTYELQSLMRSSYAVSCLKKKKKRQTTTYKE